MTLKLKPRSDCKFCMGSGEVSDSVPYGMGSTSLVSFCDCVLEQIPEEREDEEIELDLTEYRSAETIRRAEGERYMREAGESDRDDRQEKRASDAFDDYNAGERPAHWI